MKWNDFVKTAGPRPSERRAVGLASSPSSIEIAQDANPMGSLSSQKAWMKDRGSAILASQHPEDRKKFWNDYANFQRRADLGRVVFAAGAAAPLHPVVGSASTAAWSAIKAHPIVSAMSAAHAPGIAKYVTDDPKKLIRQNPLKTLGELSGVSSRTMRDIGVTAGRLVGSDGEAVGEILDEGAGMLPVFGNIRTGCDIAGNVYNNNIKGLCKNLFLNNFFAKRAIPLFSHAGYGVYKLLRRPSKRAWSWFVR